MFDPPQRSNGAEYTTRTTLLIIAFVMIPAMLMVSEPLGYMSITLGVAGSSACVAMAWMNWKKNTGASIPSPAKSARVK